MKKHKTNFKKIILTAGVAAMATIATLGFTACNGGGQGGQGGDKPVTPPAQETTTVAQVYQDHKTSILTDDLAAFANEKINKIPIVLTEDENAQTLSKTLDDKGNLTFIIKSDGTLSSYAIAVPESVKDASVNCVSDEDIIEQAGYTADQKINKTNSDIAQVVEKLQAVVAGIRAEIEKLDSKENINVVMHNDYLKFEKENGNIFTGAVREDGSILKFEVTSAGDIFETLVKKDGTSLTRSISATEKYEAPAIEAIQKISVEQIFKQYFGEFNGYNFESKAQEIAKSVTPGGNHELFFYTANSNEIAIYTHVTAINRQFLYKTTYTGNIGSDIEYFNQFKGLSDSQKLEVFAKELSISLKDEIELNSEEHKALENQIIQLKEKLTEKVENIESLTSSQFKARSLAGSTDVQLPKKANEFGEKFAPAGSEVLMTYVGDIGARNIDQFNELGSGYYSRFDVLVVYSDGNDHYIKKVSVDVPWYANSTTESLYNHIFVSDNYRIDKEENTVVENATVVEKNKQNIQAYEAFETVNLNLFAKEVEFAR